MIKTFLFLLISAAQIAAEIAVPRPSEMLEIADTVAVASLSQSDTRWLLLIKTPIKGSYRPNQIVHLTTSFHEEMFSLDELSKVVGDDDFLFLGSMDPKTQTLQPSFGLPSAWPQGTSSQLLTHRTLDQCVAFARGVLRIASNRSSPKRIEDPGTAEAKDSSSAGKIAPEGTSLASANKDASFIEGLWSKSRNVWWLALVVVIILSTFAVRMLRKKKMR